MYDEERHMLFRIFMEKETAKTPVLSNIVSIDRINIVKKQNRENDKKQKRHNNVTDLFLKTKDRFDQLSMETEQMNNVLINHESPYRYCVYRKGDNIYLDTVILDTDRHKVKYIWNKNITNDDFKKWDRNIMSGEGLILDTVS